MSETSPLRASASLWGASAAVLAALAMATNNIAVNFVYRYGGNAQTIALLRYVFVMAVLLAIVPLLRQQQPFTRRDRLHALGCGAASAIGSIGLLGSFALIPVSLAIIIAYTNPILTALFQSLLGRRLPGGLQLFCLIVALAGVALTIGIEASGADWRGIGLAVLASVGFSASFVWNGHTLRAADSSLITIWMSVSGLATVALYVLATDSFVPPPPVAAGWLALLTSSACFLLAFFCMFRGVKLIGPAPTAMIMNVEPVLTVLLAASLLGEQLTPVRILGGVIVLGAVIASEWIERHGPAG